MVLTGTVYTRKKVEGLQKVKRPTLCVSSIKKLSHRIPSLIIVKKALPQNDFPTQKLRSRMLKCCSDLFPLPFIKISKSTPRESAAMHLEFALQRPR